MRNNVLSTNCILPCDVTQIELDTKYKEKFVFDLCKTVYYIDYDYDKHVKLYTVELEIGFDGLYPNLNNYFLKHEPDDYICNILIEEKDVDFEKLRKQNEREEAINTINLYGAMNIVNYFEDTEQKDTTIVIKGVLL